MTHSYVTWLIQIWHASCTFVIWLIQMWHDSFTRYMPHSYMTWLIHMWHDSFKYDVPYVYVTWLVHTLHGSFTRDMTRLLFFSLSGTVAVHMWHGLFIRGTTHLHVTRFVYIWHDFICMCDTTQEATYEWLMSHMRKYRNESCLIWYDSRGNGTMKRRHMNGSCLIWGNIWMSHVLYDMTQEATVQSGLCLMRTR